MSVKIDAVDSPPVSPDEIARQVERVVRSQTFQSSGILRHLLEYLSGCSLEGRPEGLKVKEIARAVFGRSENFDSQGDSVVRVHTGRLRSKLAEYYIDEGADDDLIISIPKGGYDLSWHTRTNATHSVNVATLPSPLEVAPIPLPARDDSHTAGMLWKRTILFALIAASLAAVITWSVTRPAKSSLAERSQPASARFWSPFLAKGEQPLIVFSNFRLVGSLETSVRAYNDATDRNASDVIETYTTVGEVMGVFDITRYLSAFGQTARAKHGNLLTWDDARDCNLIFVGGPLAHTPLRSLSALHQLQFRHGAAGQAGAITNLHPGPGEQALYVGPQTRPFQYDYAIISSRPGLNRNRRILILAGITEFGTQGAAEVVTREDHLAELLSRLKVKPGGDLPPFEALLKIKVEGDVPVQYELLVVRRTE